MRTSATISMILFHCIAIGMQLFPNASSTNARQRCRAKNDSIERTTREMYREARSIKLLSRAATRYSPISSGFIIRRRFNFPLWLMAHRIRSYNRF